ncbi:cell division protein FtsA [Desulfothermus naphthae]
MAKGEIIVGLDIGTTKICAVIGENKNGRIHIIGSGESPSSGLRKGVVVNIEQTVKSIKEALDEAEQMSGCEIRSVYAGIAGSHIKGFNSQGIIPVRGEEITKNDIERVIDAAKAVAIPLDREVIHILPQEFIVDDQGGIEDPLGMSGVRLEVKVHIVTGAVSSAQNIIRSCHKAGLDVADIVLEPLASGYATLTDEEKEIGVALVDIGGGTTDLAVFLNDAIKHISILSLGGTNLTSDIAFGLRTPMSAAEEIKKKYGCALTDLVQDNEVIDVPTVGGRPPRRLFRKTLAEICEPRMEEILALVDQDLEKSGYKPMIGAGVVLTGGSSLIEGIVELAEQIFGLPVRIGYPKGIGGLTDIVMNPKYATAVGLLLYGARKENFSTSFRIRERNVFDRLLSKMKNWFVDIS